MSIFSLFGCHVVPGFVGRGGAAAESKKKKDIGL